MSTPARFRKLLVVVEAMQWTGRNEAEMRAFAPSFFAIDPQDRGDDPDVTAQVDGPYTWEPVRTGDWVTLRNGQYDVFRDDEFRRTYEQVSA